MGINLLTMLVVLMMLVGAPIVEFSPKAVDALYPLLNTADNLSRGLFGLDFSVRFILILVLLLNGYEIVKTLYRMLGNKLDLGFHVSKSTKK